MSDFGRGRGDGRGRGGGRGDGRGRGGGRGDGFGRGGGRGDGRGRGRGRGRGGGAVAAELSLAEQLEALRGEAIRAKRAGNHDAARAAFGKCRAIEAQMKAAGISAAPQHANVERPANAVLGTPHAEEGFVLTERQKVSDSSYVLKFELPRDK